MITHYVAELVSALPVQIPNPEPQAPPGAEMVLKVVSWIKWIALISVLGAFFGGIMMASAGRIWDHHGSGRMGARLMTGSLMLAMMSGVGYGLITAFAGAN